MKKSLLLLMAATFVVGCNAQKKLADVKTPGDPSNAPNYGYTPIDPLPAYFDDTLAKSQSLILNVPGNNRLAGLLSEETMRIAIGSYDTKGNLSFATAGIGYEGSNYVVVLDYIKYIPKPLFTESVDSGGTKTIRTINNNINRTQDTTAQPVVMSLYVGVGLRITANLHIMSGSLSLGDIFGIGASASISKTSGTLTVQTLGITGDGISSLIPIPSELNTTTIQNAILSLGSIKAKMYEPATILSPRVLGFYNNVGGIGSVITNKLISQVLTSQIIVEPRVVKAPQ